MTETNAKKVEGIIRKLEALQRAFDMRGANATTMKRAIDTIRTLARPKVFNCYECDGPLNGPYCPACNAKDEAVGVKPLWATDLVSRLAVTAAGIRPNSSIIANLLEEARAALSSPTETEG